MATMNKPAANDSNWYQAITDNWTSIETNLIDKSIFAAKGDLLAATGASTPARLAVGSNGQILYADSTQSSGVKWGDVLDSSESLLLKSFFSGQGFLPSTVIKETLFSWPTADFSNPNGATLALAMSRVKYTPGTNPANFGWSLGGTYSKALVIVGGMRPRQWNQGIFLSNSLPVAPDLPDGYLFNNEPVTPAMRIYKVNGGGSYTSIASDATIYSDDQYSIPSCALAAYVDGSAHRLMMWSRMGPETWMLIHDITDSTFTSFKYAGIYFGTFGSSQWSVCPLAIYAQ